MSSTDGVPALSSTAVPTDQVPANEHSNEVIADTVAAQSEQNDDAGSVETDEIVTHMDPVPKDYSRKRRHEELRVVIRDAVASDPAAYDLANGLDRIVGHADSSTWALEKLGSLLKPIPSTKIPKIFAYVPAPVIPELKYWTLAEWRESKRPTSSSGLSTIDVLLEEVYSDDSRQRGFRKNPTLSATGTSPADTIPRNANARPTLPPRMRINSISTKRLLSSVCDDNLSNFAYDMPVILDRPFKVLVLFNGPIREKLQELRTLLRTRETYFDAHPDTRTPSELSSRTGPGGGLFSTGTDWDILTLHELQQAIDEFSCLVQFMDKFLVPIAPDQYPIELPFVDLWHLFMSDDYIFVRNRPQKVWRVLQATGGRRYLSGPPPESDQSDRSRISPGSYSDFIIDAYHLDYNGTAIIPVFAKFSMERGDEYVQLRNLPCLPLQIAQKEGLIDIDATRARGEMFLEYFTPQHRHYNGLTLSRTTSGSDLLRSIPGDILPQRVYSERIDSQVIVDFERATQANPNWNTSGSEPKITIASPNEINDFYDIVEPDLNWDKSFSDELLEEQGKLWRSWEKGTGQPDGDNLLLLPDQV